MKRIVDSPKKKKEHLLNKNWFYFLFAESLLGLISLVWMALIPRDLKNSFLFGFSPYRLLLLAIQFLLFLVPLTFWIGFRKKNKLCLQIINKTQDIHTFRRIKIVALGFFILDSVYLVLFPLIRNPVIVTYLTRIQPLIVWQFFTCAFVIIVPINKNNTKSFFNI